MTTRAGREIQAREVALPPVRRDRANRPTVLEPDADQILKRPFHLTAVGIDSEH